MNTTERPSTIVRLTLRLEQAVALDQPVQALEPTIRALFGTGKRSAVLRGEWLGHAVHPVLTDVVIGTWTSASLLDVLGGRDSASRSACTRPHGSPVGAAGTTPGRGSPSPEPPCRASARISAAT
jgi:hypothetical protein